MQIKMKWAQNKLKTETEAHKVYSQITTQKLSTVVRKIFVINKFLYAQLCTKFFIAVYKVCMLLR